MAENEKNSKFKGDKSTTIALIIFVILCIFIIIECVALFGNKDKNNGVAEETYAPTSSAAPEVTKAPETTEGGDIIVTDAPTYVPTAEATQNPTIAPTSAPTSAPTAAPATPSAPSGDFSGESKAAKIIDAKSIDYSFLNGVSRESFEDADEGSFDWYPGKVTHKDGKLVYDWDRYPSTLNYIKQYGALYRKNPDVKAIYLTFDCGYENGVTEKILDVLKEKNASGIFFVTGDYVDSADNQRIMRRMIDEGSLIGSHTENHKEMPKLSDEEFVNELNTVYAKMKKIMGDDFTWAYYRPPQGATNPRDLALAKYLGYNTALWAFAYGDYNPDNQPDPAEALAKLKDGIHPGAVYLLHAISSTNAAILGDFIDYARSEGYEIRRIDK